MKEFVKAVIPKSWLPLARRVAGRPDTRAVKPQFNYKGVDRLSALLCTVAYNQYGGYCVPTSSCHRPATQAVLAGTVYEPQTIEYMTQNCGDRDIVHAGTFFGDFLPALSAALDSNALLWGFEPNLENFRCASITAALNGLQNVRLTNAGLGAGKGQLYLNTLDKNGRPLGGASHVVDSPTDLEGVQPVDIVAIDETVPEDRKIGILQLDVEGYEQEALSGALMTIRRCTPIIILEILPNSELEEGAWFAENILSIGYRRVARLHGNSVYQVST